MRHQLWLLSTLFVSLSWPNDVSATNIILGDWIIGHSVGTSPVGASLVYATGSDICAGWGETGSVPFNDYTCEPVFALGGVSNLQVGGCGGPTRWIDQDGKRYADCLPATEKAPCNNELYGPAYFCPVPAGAQQPTTSGVISPSHSKTSHSGSASSHSNTDHSTTHHSTTPSSTHHSTAPQSTTSSSTSRSQHPSPTGKSPQGTQSVKSAKQDTYEAYMKSRQNVKHRSKSLLDDIEGLIKKAVDEVKDAVKDFEKVAEEAALLSELAALEEALETALAATAAAIATDEAAKTLEKLLDDASDKATNADKTAGDNPSSSSGPSSVSSGPTKSGPTSKPGKSTTTSKSSESTSTKSTSKTNEPTAVVDVQAADQQLILEDKPSTDDDDGFEFESPDAQDRVLNNADLEIEHQAPLQNSEWDNNATQLGDAGVFVSKRSSTIQTMGNTDANLTLRLLRTADEGNPGDFLAVKHAQVCKTRYLAKDYQEHDAKKPIYQYFGYKFDANTAKNFEWSWKLVGPQDTKPADNEVRNGAKYASEFSGF